ncbi:MAG: hypothetical protein NUV55_04625 [Sulfuricaulis sp.]|uniref:hypothetical protein n=1 Tax=Sulfuricaulis sp. TaxID=2003553 RepID=UPI0025EB400C|nr:hypothetical protein [Sulfuricaulis sp.]MCR4346478.1 hypothetical protein [Sulfuricaulis sp.]
MAYDFAAIHLNSQTTSNFWERLDAYRDCATRLNEYRQEIKWGTHSVSVERTIQGLPRITGSLPNERELEGLLLRFRLFVLKSEKSCFEYFINALHDSSSDELLKLYTSYAKREFHKSKILGNALLGYQGEYTPMTIIDIWFNSHYFHRSGKRSPLKAAKLKNFKSAVSENGAKITLFHAVWDVCNLVRNVNFLVANTSRENPVVLVPVSCNFGHSCILGIDDSEFKTQEGS